MAIPTTGKYQPELVQGGRADAQRGVKAGVATHSGKLLHTEQRFKVTLTLT